MKRLNTLLQARADLLAQARQRLDAAAGRDLTDDERAADDADVARIGALDAEILRENRLADAERTAPARQIVAQAPAVIEKRGDDFGMALGAWLKTGDVAALAGGDGLNVSQDGVTLMAASNATDMNIGTAADGGNLVPRGFLNQIQARRDELALYRRLPVMMVPGSGTTVDVPTEAANASEFVEKAEAADFDMDAPVFGTKALTLKKYTKYLDVSYELLEDTPTALLQFLANWVGRGMAQTHNSLLLTEVGTNGTKFADFGASALAFGDPEKILANNVLANYLESDGVAAWVMRSATHWAINSIVGNDRQYSQNIDGINSVLGYPVLYSQHAAAVAASNKSIFFGNWNQVGMREAPGLTFVRDPYTVAIKGQVRLLWHFRTVYGVLQPQAIGYGQHAAS